MRRWLPVAVWVGIVLSASTDIGSHQHSAGPIRAFILWLFPQTPFAVLEGLHLAGRKAAHVGQFFIFTLLIWRAVYLRPRLPIARWKLTAHVVLVSLVVSVASEGIQLGWAGRNASWADVGFNLLGTGLGLLVMLGFSPWLDRREARKSRPAVKP